MGALARGAYSKTAALLFSLLVLAAGLFGTSGVSIVTVVVCLGSIVTDFNGRCIQ